MPIRYYYAVTKAYLRHIQHINEHRYKKYANRRTVNTTYIRLLLRVTLHYAITAFTCPEFRTSLVCIVKLFSDAWSRLVAVVETFTSC